MKLDPTRNLIGRPLGCLCVCEDWSGKSFPTLEQYTIRMVKFKSFYSIQNLPITILTYLFDLICSNLVLPDLTFHDRRKRWVCNIFLKLSYAIDRVNYVTKAVRKCC